MTALATALDERFFTQARALKRAHRDLGVASAAGGRAGRRRRRRPRGADFAAARAALARLEQAVRGALDSERIALRARLDETYRRAALEVREFVRPRSWLFGEHRATAADEAFLAELLEDSVTGALARTRAALLAPRLARRDHGADGTAIVAAIDPRDRSLRRLRARRDRRRRGPRLLPPPAAAPAPRGRRHPRRARAPRPRSGAGAVRAAAPRAGRAVRRHGARSRRRRDRRRHARRAARRPPDAARSPRWPRSSTTANGRAWSPRRVPNLPRPAPTGEARLRPTRS